jgi:tRNA A37 threonylcarbamoyltransferase TsaD
LAVKPLPIYLPYSKKLFTDNAAMIGIAAYHHWLKKDFVEDVATLDRQPNLNF